MEEPIIQRVKRLESNIECGYKELESNFRGCGPLNLIDIVVSILLYERDLKVLRQFLDQETQCTNSIKKTPCVNPPMCVSLGKEWLIGSFLGLFICALVYGVSYVIYHYL